MRRMWLKLGIVVVGLPPLFEVFLIVEQTETQRMYNANLRYVYSVNALLNGRLLILDEGLILLGEES